MNNEHCTTKKSAIVHKLISQNIFQVRLNSCPFHNVILLQRVHLDIQVGEHAINYADVAQKEKLSELQLRVRQLLDQVEQITKEQNYQRVSQRQKR